MRIEERLITDDRDVIAPGSGVIHVKEEKVDGWQNGRPFTSCIFPSILHFTC